MCQHDKRRKLTIPSGEQVAPQKKINTKSAIIFGF